MVSLGNLEVSFTFVGSHYHPSEIMQRVLCLDGVTFALYSLYSAIFFRSPASPHGASEFLIIKRNSDKFKQSQLQ